MAFDNVGSQWICDSLCRQYYGDVPQNTDTALDDAWRLGTWQEPSKPPRRSSMVHDRNRFREDVNAKRIGHKRPIAYKYEQVGVPEFRPNAKVNGT